MAPPEQASIFAGALVAEIVIDGGIDRFWEWKNHGKLWKDVEAKLALLKAGYGSGE